MGIRYDGWAVTTDETARAFDDPWPVMREADRRYRSPGWASVDLDKAWGLMQGLFWSERLIEPRPAYALVAGDVTYPEDYARGYEPHVGVLPREQVRTIAHDIATVGEPDVRSYCADRRGDDLEYLTHHLRAAQEFTADAAARGHGIVYTIG